MMPLPILIHHLQSQTKGDLADIVYADDTLLLAASDGHLQEFLSIVSVTFSSMWSLHSHTDRGTPRGTPGIGYLAAVVTHKGLPGHELGRRRIGIAKADFTDLPRVRKHSSLPVHRKAYIYKTLFESEICMVSAVYVVLQPNVDNSMGSNTDASSYHWHSTFVSFPCSKHGFLHRTR